MSVRAMTRWARLLLLLSVIFFGQPRLVSIVDGASCQTECMGAGWSQGKHDRASAETEALAVCAQHGKACALQTSFNELCGARAPATSP